MSYGLMELMRCWERGKVEVECLLWRLYGGEQGQCLHK